jgi:protein-S-isoprenylcysteine O-methyltransferase Ste14
MLHDEMVRQGGFLFRWRSFLPLALVPVGLAAIQQSGLLDVWLGDALEEGWMLFCLGLAMAGQTLRAYTVGHVPVGTSGRNTRTQRAEALNTTGLYSVCRHPLYLANFIVFVGILLAVQVWWFLLIGVLAFWVYYERIMATEEAFLSQKFGHRYVDWAAQTPAFLPAFSRWRKPERVFSWKMVLRREPYGYFAIISAFFAIELVADLFIEGDTIADWLQHDMIWPLLFGLGGIAFLILRTLKKTTSLFSIENS